MSEHDDKLLSHDYDGIKELDNNLPRWWVGLFWVTVVWGVLYFVYYHGLNIGPDSATEYLMEIDPNYQPPLRNHLLFGIVKTYRSPYSPERTDKTPFSATLGEPTEAYVEETREGDTLSYTLLTEPEAISSGLEVYIKNCVQCHGASGEGGIGPNLTDQYWLHGAETVDVVKSIKYGYPAKGMIAWRTFLSSEKLIEVASYIQTLRGTNPSGGKGPQGDLVED